MNVKAHEPIRNIIIRQGMISFVSYIGNVFSGVQCPTIILGITKGAVQGAAPSAVKDATQGAVKVCCEGKEHYVSGIQALNGTCINLRPAGKERGCLEAIEASADKVFLKGNATFALGIVTGNNKQMILDKQEDGCETILKGSDIKRYTWAPGGHFIRFIPRQFQQAAPTECYRAPEKLLYRFICDAPVFAYDDRQTLSLNSCNILIPRIQGLSAKYIMAVLNSRATDFYCRQTFHSVKLLRSHIEQIPIPIPSAAKQRQIVAAVDALLAGQVPAIAVYEDIDSMVMELYRLSAAEKAIIRKHGDNRSLYVSQ